MDLEKAYDTIDLHGMWQLLRMYGVQRKIVESSAEFYIVRRVSGLEMM